MKLLDLAISPVFADRVLAGTVIDRLVAPGETLRRRTESIQILNSTTSLRIADLDLDLRSARDWCRSVEVELDCAVLSLSPKALSSGFEITTGDGSVVGSLSRRLDSRLAQCFLVSLAVSREKGLPGLRIPSQAIWTLIYEHCFKFPIEFNHYQSLAHALELGSGLTDRRDREWWMLACNSKRWRTWLLRLGELFMVSTDLHNGDRHQRFTVKRKSGRDPIPNPGVADALLRTAKPSVPLALRLYDLGHAGSEHIRLHAADGTFLSGGVLAQTKQPPLTNFDRTVAQNSEREVLKYRRRASRHEVLIYVENAAPGNCLLLANMWPETRGFVTPLRYIAYYTVAISLFVAVATAFSDLSDLRRAADATFMILYLLPTIAIGALLRPDSQPEVRWRMLAWSRQYATVLVAVSLSLSLIWLFEPMGWVRWLTVGGYCFGGIAAAVVAIKTRNVTQGIIVASRTARSEESGPARGHSLKLVLKKL